MSKPNKIPYTQRKLKTLFSYNPDDGSLFWNGRPRSHFKCDQAFKAWNSKYKNKKITSVCGRGYVRVCIDYKRYKAHRIIWKMITGNDPEFEIDHINGIRTDNRRINLRSATSSENKRNQKLRKDNTSSVVGVSYLAREKKWHAQVSIFGRHISLGNHSSFDAAVKARKRVEVKYGFHENHGRK